MKKVVLSKDHKYNGSPNSDICIHIDFIETDLKKDYFFLRRITNNLCEAFIVSEIFASSPEANNKFIQFICMKGQQKPDTFIISSIFGGMKAIKK